MCIFQNVQFLSAVEVEVHLRSLFLASSHQRYLGADSASAFLNYVGCVLRSPCLISPDLHCCVVLLLSLSYSLLAVLSILLHDPAQVAPCDPKWSAAEFF